MTLSLFGPVHVIGWVDCYSLSENRIIVGRDGMLAKRFLILYM